MAKGGEPGHEQGEPVQPFPPGDGETGPFRPCHGGRVPCPPLEEGRDRRAERGESPALGRWPEWGAQKGGAQVGRPEHRKRSAWGAQEGSGQGGAREGTGARGRAGARRRSPRANARGSTFFLSLYKRSLLCAGPMHGVIQKRGRSVRHLPGAQGRLRARKKPCAAALLFRGHCRGFCTFRALGGGTPQGAFPTGHRRLHFGHAQGFYAQDHVCLCAGRRTEKTRELCSKSPRSRAMEGPCSRAGVLLVDLHGKQPEAYDKSHKNGANTQYQSSKFHTILLGFVQDKRRRTSWNGASVIVCILI